MRKSNLLADRDADRDVAVAVSRGHKLPVRIVRRHRVRRWRLQGPRGRESLVRGDVLQHGSSRDDECTRGCGFLLHDQRAASVGPIVYSGNTVRSLE